MDIIKFIRAKKFSKRLNYAIKQADDICMKTGRKTLVLNFSGRPIAKTKIELKQLIHAGFFKCDIRVLENLSLYKTY